MGSPQYGTLMLDGTQLVTGAPVDEASLRWSPDGRYLAATLLERWDRDPVTKVIVIDSETRTILAASSEVHPGLGEPIEFIGRSLRYDHHSHRSEGPYPADRFLPF